MLCFWKTCDLNDFLSHALVKLSEEVRVDLENVPSTATIGKFNKNSLISSDKK